MTQLTITNIQEWDTNYQGNLDLLEPKLVSRYGLRPQLDFEEAKKYDRCNDNTHTAFCVKATCGSP
jgi:hypothetical protein